MGTILEKRDRYTLGESVEEMEKRFEGINKRFDIVLRKIRSAGHLLNQTQAETYDVEYDDEELRQKNEQILKECVMLRENLMKVLTHGDRLIEEANAFYNKLKG